MKETEIY